jgi:hypothetical protein
MFRNVVAAAVGAALCLLLFGCAGSEGQQGAGTAHEETIRTELFEKAHRAALECTPGMTNQLSVELTLIEPALKTDAERRVFKAFQAVNDVEIDLITLETGKKATEEFAAKADKMTGKFQSGNATIGKITFDVENFLPDESRNWVRELKAARQVSQGSGVVVSMRDPANAGVAVLEKLRDLAARHSITPQALDTVQWIPYHSTRTKLLDVHSTLTKEAAASLHP